MGPLGTVRPRAHRHKTSKTHHSNFTSLQVWNWLLRRLDKVQQKLLKSSKVHKTRKMQGPQHLIYYWTKVLICTTLTLNPHRKTDNNKSTWVEHQVEKVASGDNRLLTIWIREDNRTIWHKGLETKLFRKIPDQVLLRTKDSSTISFRTRWNQSP